MPRNWFQHQWLASGTPRQQQAWQILESLLLTLHPFTPVLAGTIPLNIDIPGSDLDLLCRYEVESDFVRLITQHFQNHPQFRMRRKVHQGQLSLVVSFLLQDQAMEIFAQNRPVWEQNGFRHMVVEARLLSLGGPSAQAGIRQLKREGLKTEPAFACWFGLPGHDPYQTLYDLSFLKLEELRSYLAQHGRQDMPVLPK